MCIVTYQLSRYHTNNTQLYEQNYVSRSPSPFVVYGDSRKKKNKK